MWRQGLRSERLDLAGSSPWDESWRDAEGSVFQDQIVGDSGYAECVDAVLALRRLAARDTLQDSGFRSYVRPGPGWDTEERRLAGKRRATLPTSTRNTGYHLGDLQLWLGKDARETAYLVEGSKVERWPRLVEPVGCV